MHLDYEELYMGRGNISATKIAPSNLRNEMESAIKLYLDEVKWMADSMETLPWINLRSSIEQRFNEVNVSMNRKKTTGSSDVNTSTNATV